MAHFTDFYTDTPRFTHEAGLAVMRELMKRLDDPQDGLRCIHIAGTNGKGSCAAMTASVLQAAGYRTGLYTSPDLNGLHERIRVNNVPIAQAAFEDITQKVASACTGLPEPSYFEKITAAAFLYFKQAGCDYVVLETGLGGRLDATNIISSPVCSVIMPIGLDHTQQLGNTIAAITAEKCGIIKNRCPVVSAPQLPDAAAVIRQACRDANAPLISVAADKIKPLIANVSGQTFSYRDTVSYTIRLLGHHQLENACAVLEIARLLTLPSQAVYRGLSDAVWPGRLEYFPGTPPVLLDGAHNAHGAAALSRALDDYFPGKKFTVILAVMADKDWSDILGYILPHACRVICTAPDSPRALPPDRLAEQIKTLPTKCTASPAQALTVAQSYTEPVLACGSLYAIGALRTILVDS